MRLERREGLLLKGEKGYWWPWPAERPVWIPCLPKNPSSTPEKHSLTCGVEGEGLVYLSGHSAWPGCLEQDKEFLAKMDNQRKRQGERSAKTEMISHSRPHAFLAITTQDQ